MNKRFYLISILLVLLALSAIVIILIAIKKVDPNSTTFFLLEEGFKTALAFLVITIAGVLVKQAVELSVESQRLKREEQKRQENLREDLMEKLVNNYSGFYSVRKFYHSFLRKKNLIFSDPQVDKSRILQELLRRVTDLEGEYGSIKVRVVNHFELPKGNWGTKSIEDLLGRIEITQGEKETIRLYLDLLGEYYDDWRDALEENRRIIEGRSEFFQAYTTILDYIEKGKIREVTH